MKNFDSMTKEIFDELPFKLPENLVSPNHLMFVSKEAVGIRPFLVQGDIHRFVESAPDGYFMTGFYGHGLSSDAFYYCRVDAKSKILFRLPYGGGYHGRKKDFVENNKYISDFLRSFFEFEKNIQKNVTSIIAVNSMGYCFYEIKLKNGKIIKEKDFFWRIEMFEKLTSQII